MRLVLYLVAAVVVVVVGIVLVQETYWRPGHTALQGHWQLDDDTRTWMQRTCIDLVFADTARASMSILVDGSTAEIRFNDVKGTRLTGSLRRRELRVRQIVGTSEVGRFCGAQTVLSISCRVSRLSPDELVARWTTPACDVCPDRRFRALRTGSIGADPPAAGSARVM